MGKAYKCYHCQNIVKEEDLIIKPIPMQTKAGMRDYKRKFHFECLPKFLKNGKDIALRSDENSSRDLLYQYIKEDILNQKATLSKYWIDRVDGLYTGQFIARGVNRRALTERGYPYETIHLAFETIAPRMIQRLNMTDIKDDKHRCNAAIYMIEPLLPVLQQGLERAERAERKVEAMDKIEVLDYHEEFKAKPKKKKEEVKSFDELFGDFDI